MQARSNKRLKLFVDVNGTIIPTDFDKELKDALFEMVSKKTKAHWVPGLKHPISHRHYIDTYVYPGDANDPNIKKQRAYQYNHILEAAKHVDEATYQAALTLYNQLTEKLHGEVSVFKSFLAAIFFLEKEFKDTYNIYLRTLGRDRARIAKELEKCTQLSFSHSFHFPEKPLTVDEKVKLLSELAPGVHGAWQDNYNYWKASGFQHQAGKPFIIDINNTNEIPIFFDDHVKNKRIIYVDLLGFELENRIDPEIFQELLQPLLIEMGFLVEVDTTDAILKDNYFEEKIKRSLTADINELKRMLPIVAEQALKKTLEKIERQQAKVYAKNKMVMFKENIEVSSETTFTSLSLKK